jgi:hypothetical protein
MIIISPVSLCRFTSDNIRTDITTAQKIVALRFIHNLEEATNGHYKIVSGLWSWIFD